MNLYKTNFKHYAPKDSEEGIKDLFLALNDLDAFNHVDSTHNYDSWQDTIKEFLNDEAYEMFERKGNADEFLESILENKGSINLDLSCELNLYYGHTELGWELVKENILEEEINLLKQLNILSNE